MAVTKGASQQVKTSTLRQVLFVLSIGLCLASFYFMLDFQTSAQAKLSGELILGQVDSVTYNHQGSPIISFLFEYFGALSYFLALMIVYLGYYLLLRPVDIWHADFYRASLRVLGFDLSLIGLCALGSLYGDLGATGAGGLLGDMLIMFSSTFLPSLLSAILFAFVAFSGLAFLFGKSPLFVFDSLGATFFKAVPGAKAKPEAKTQASEPAAEPTAPAAAAAAADGAAQATAPAAAPEQPLPEMAEGHLTVAQFEEQLRKQGQLEPEAAAYDPNQATAQRPAEASSLAAENVSALAGGNALSGAGNSFFEQALQQPLPSETAPAGTNLSGAWTSGADATPVEAQELEQSLQRSFSGESTDFNAADYGAASQGQASPATDTNSADLAASGAWGELAPAAAAAVAEPFAEQLAEPTAASTPMPTMEHAPSADKGSFNAAAAYGQGDVNYWQGQGALAEAAFNQSHARNAPDELESSLTDPNEVHTKIVRGPDPVALQREQAEAAVPETAPDTRAESAPDLAPAEPSAAAPEEQAPAPRPGAELSPYGYGTYAAEQAQDVSAVLSQEPTAEEQKGEADADAVHTIVQRVDPQVFAAEQEARRREREEAARKAQEEAQRAQAEAEAAEAERQAQEQTAQAAQTAPAEPQAAPAEEDAPIYAGTYAAQLEREQQQHKPQPIAQQAEERAEDDGPKYITPGVAGSEPQSVSKDKSNESVQLAEHNAHEIGARLPEELRPHTIIRDTRKEFEAAQAAKAAAAAAAAAAASAAATTAASATVSAAVDVAAASEASAETVSSADAVADEPAETQGPSTIIMRAEPVAAPVAEPVAEAVAEPAPQVASESSTEQPAASAELSMPSGSGAAILGQDAAPKSQDIIKELSSLASEFKDAAEGSLSSFRSDQESSALTELSSGTMEPNASVPPLKTALEQAAPTVQETQSSGSTHIMVGSGAPEQGFDAHEADTRTNIMRSTPQGSDSDDDNDFYRFAVARSNDPQAPKSSVAVNLLNTDDDFTSGYTPEHAYDFGGQGQQAGAIDERLSGTGAASLHDEDFVTGATHSVTPPVRTQNFNFADLAKAKAQEQGLSAHEAISRVPTAPDESSSSDNIIDFAHFDTPQPSYEVDKLTSAFIPAEDNGADGAIDGADLSTMVEEEAPAAAPEAPAPEVVAPEPETEPDANSDYEDNEAEDGEDTEDGDDSDEYYDDAEPAAGNEAYAGQMMGLQGGVYQGQQMQYMQLPNGQFVPVMAGANMMGMNPNMMGMMPNIAMGQMPQYMQLPNGQYVPVMGQNMAPNMMYPGMAQMPGTIPGQMNAPLAPAQMQGQMPGQVQGTMQGQLPGAMPGALPGQMQEALQGQMAGQTPAQIPAPTQTMGTDSAPSQVEPAVPPELVAQSEPVAAPEDEAASVEDPAPLDAHTMGAHGPSAVGLPTAGNAFMGAHNSSSTNLPSYMAGIASDSLSPDVHSSLALCTVPRHHYDDWRPGLELLARSNHKVEISYEELDKTAERINNVLHSYGIKAKVADYMTGPVITRFDLDLDPGVKSTAISSIETELCRNLLVPNVRVVPIIEGSPYVGLEVPNPQRQFITLGDMAISNEFQHSKAALPMCLGASVVGEPVVKDLADSPHLLVAGTTGSGKSAGLNTMLISLLLKRSPAELRLILVDPKQLEFSIYKDLPHLITPVITDVADKTPIALRWCVDEMERRFKLMSLLGVRKLAEYNELIKKKRSEGTLIPDPLWTLEMGPKPQSLEPLPWIVVVVEEFADLMAQSGRKKDRENTPESLIARLSAKSRAAGIHLVLVTQTPRSEVVTGMIKANFPSRVAFTVQNRIDSTIVLDEKGAECLLGNGDMLYKFTGSSTATRAHGAFTSNEDVMAVVNAWRDYSGAPEYLEDVIAVPEEPSEEGESGDKPKELDVKFDQAVQLVRDYMDSRNKPPTVTDLQTELGVGYPRAKKIYKQLTTEGIID